MSFLYLNLLSLDRIEILYVLFSSIFAVLKHCFLFFTWKNSKNTVCTFFMPKKILKNAVIFIGFGGLKKA
ncbi:unnamed protein product [Blepharisma stoltei]|uniref:Uncharacterized protein n=1 Tax=Blepharisma stoltei TaxID=1481888 RepID=A0AAU9IN31_9CILI|nr:unnamed protein product [Blepharisma stoltei]